MFSTPAISRTRNAGCAASFVVAAYPKVRLTPCGFARLACELFTKSSEIRLFTKASYINPAIFAEDNGRVLGYDNAHGLHHRHCMGHVEPIEFESYTSVLDKFQVEWQDLLKRKREKRL